jgi:hypothetical protein
LVSTEDRGAIRDLIDDARRASSHAQTHVNPACPGARGRLVHRAKRFIARSLGWYVDPPVDALRRSTGELAKAAEALLDQVDRLRSEVESIRRDLDRAHWVERR